MQTVIKKWGNSSALRLSRAIMKSAQLQLEQAVSVKVLRGKIVVEPITQKEYSLDQLIGGINAKNIHNEVDFGKPAGKEML
jgi:antitoxin MazE